MKKTIFSLLPLVMFIFSISSCQTPTSCGPGTTWSAYANNGMGGCVPNSGSGTTTQQPDQLRYVLPVGLMMSTTTVYRSNGNLSPNKLFYAQTYNNVPYNGDPNNVSTQYRKCTVKTIGTTSMPLTALADQNLLQNVTFEADVNQLMSMLKNWTGNKSELQQYKDKLIPVYVISYNGFQKGADSFNSATGELSGAVILYEVQPGVEWHTVAEVYGLQ